MTKDKSGVLTKDGNVVNIPINVYLSKLTPRNQEADTRIQLHTKHASETRYNSITIRTAADSDVVVITFYEFKSLKFPNWGSILILVNSETYRLFPRMLLNLSKVYVMVFNFFMHLEVATLYLHS